MSTMVASTANRIGVRRKYKPVTAMGVYRAPSETPPRQGDFRTQALPGLGAVPEGYFGTPAAIISPARVPFLQSGSNPGVQTGPVWEHTMPIVFHGGTSNPTISPSSPTNQTPVAATPATPSAAPPAPNQYTDSYGNVWEQSASGWVMVSPGAATQTSPTPQTTALPSTAATTQPALTSGAASTAQAGTPVPVGWPINSPYTDSTGYIWTYTAGIGWSVTGTEPGSAAATYVGGINTPTATAGATSPGTTVSVSSGFDISSLTTWLQESTILSPVPNFFVVAGGGLLALMLLRTGKR